MRYFRFSSLLMAATLLGGSVALADTILRVPSGCATPPAIALGNVFYIDPVKGGPAGDGSLLHPWNSLQSISGITYAQAAWHPPGCNGDTSGSCTTGPLLASQPYWHYDMVQRNWVSSTNPNAPIKPGDTILLMSGNYGDVTLTSIRNSSFITIAAAPGQAAVLGSIQLGGSTKWIIRGLTFRELANGNSALVDISSNSFSGAGSDIIIDSNDLASQDNVGNWTKATWLASSRAFALRADGGDQYSTYEKCITFTNNNIANVRNGMVVEADNMLVDSNTINGYGDDGLVYAANNLTITNNKIINNHDIGDSNHNDAMQGQPGRGVGGVTVFNNILIGGNTIMAQATRNLPFPGVLQGIDAFDMDWSNVTIINNVVITNAYHGISFYSLHGGLIANNTVLASGNLSTWLGVFDNSHQGSPSNNVVVRNNILSNLNMSALAASITADHNLVGGQIVWAAGGHLQYITDPGSYGDNNEIDSAGLTQTFQKFDTSKADYNVHLLPGSGAVGTGNPIAPPNIAGARRRSPVDEGAYVYTPSAAAIAAR